MSTDTVTPRDPWPVLAAVLLNAEPGASWSSNSWHDEAVLAGLRSGQIVAAHKRAVRDGYLAPMGRWINGKWSPNMERAEHVKADGRWVTLYERTSVALPGQTWRAEVPGQMDLLEVGA